MKMIEMETKKKKTWKELNPFTVQLGQAFHIWDV